MLLYRYGFMAWIWRLLILGALAGAAICLWFGVRLGAAVLVLIGAVLATPALFFGFVLAVRVDRLEHDRLRVHTLLFVGRRLRRETLGKPRLREIYHNLYGPLYAPAAWVPVRGRLPIYLDLLGTIPDRKAFGTAFRIAPAALPNAARTP